MRNPIRMKPLVVGIGLVLLVALGAQAQTVPTMMSYQGRLSANGTNFTGTGYFKFAPVSADGLTTYWSNDGSFPTHVAVSNGLFSVMLGDTSLPFMQPIFPSTFQERPGAQLRIWFCETEGGAFAQLAPDQPLGSVGYAMMAAKVGPGAVGASELASDSVKADKIETNAVTSDKLAANSVTAVKIAAGVITSNKIDWSTMPAMSLKGYKENGAFAAAPVASGADSIAQGSGARALADYSVVGGGGQNEIQAGAVYGAIGGGRINDLGNNSSNATVAGGYDNNISSDANSSTIGGGFQNNIGVGSWYATVAGGYDNTLISNVWGSAISGGRSNTIGFATDYAAVAGGWGNKIGRTADYSAIGGGNLNEIQYDSECATVAGGLRNIIGTNSNWSVIGGGNRNEIGTISSYTTVAGGLYNSIGAEAHYATIAGGCSNAVGDNAEYAFAAGRRAKANHIGSFVWADSVNADFASTVSNQFRIRAGGGLSLVAQASGISQAACRIESTTANGVGLFITQTSSDANLVIANTGTGDQIKCYYGPGGGTLAFRVDNEGDTIGRTFTPTSDRNAKENFVAVDPQDILARVVELPISRWNFKQDETLHIGPMAQDFHAAFAVGIDDKHIATVDADGVALAAIQALDQGQQDLKQQLQEKEERIQALENDVAELKQLVSQLVP